MVHLTSATFTKETGVSDTLVVVDFWASWCGPCRMLAPVLEKIEGEMPDVKFCKVNVDEEPELANKFNIHSIPTLVFIKNGSVADVSVGYMGEASLKSKIGANK